MKNYFCKAFVLIGLIAMTSAELSAQCIQDQNGNYTLPTGEPCDPVNTIITALPFLRIVPDARFGGMGDLGIAMSPDPNSIHFNASHLAFVDKDLSISATYTPWLRALQLNDVYLAYLSAYKRIDKLQTVGFSLRYFSLGSIQFTDNQGNPLNIQRPNEFAISLAYARKLSKSLSGALTMKYLYSRLATGDFSGEQLSPGTGVAADVSVTYKRPIETGDTESLFTAGLAITNIGTKIKYNKSRPESDYIPTNLGLGASFEYNIDDYNSFTIGLDINKLLVPTPTEGDEDGDGILDYRQMAVPTAMFSSFGDAPGGFGEEMRELMYSVGFEYWYDKQFGLRAGYYSEHATKGARKFFTVGVGLKYNIFGLNFSYLVPTSNQRNPLDNTLRFSLLFDFGAFAGDEAPDDL